MPVEQKADLAAGTPVGAYLLTGILGRGGMGVVYSAVQPQIEKRVAIKVLDTSSKDPAAIDRFVQEARVVGRIEHPSVVGIYSFGLLPDGRPYYVMEFVPGRSLARLLEERGALSFAEALPILQGVAEGLAAVHELGIAHRDLKPANVLVVEEPGKPPIVKILDFGIAKLFGEGAQAAWQTRSGTVIGSPSYMSPEQCNGSRDIDHRSDIYALGVIAYRMFTGRLPFVAESKVDLFFMHTRLDPPSPAAIAGVPARLEAIILRALAKERDDRYQHMSDLLADLATLPETVRSFRPRPRAPASEPVPADAPTRTELPSRPPRRRAALGIALVSFTIAAVVAGVAMVRRAPNPAAIAAPAAEPAPPPAPVASPAKAVVPPDPSPAARPRRHKTPKRSDGFAIEW